MSFLARHRDSPGRDRRDAVTVATYLRDCLPFPGGRDCVRASGVYPSASLTPGDPVREAVASAGGAEFWIEDSRDPSLIHSVYVVTERREPS